MRKSLSRQATPSRVALLWDAIYINETERQVNCYDAVVSNISSQFGTTRSEIDLELTYAIRDRLVVVEYVKTRNGEETELYKLPNPDSFKKGSKDWYCFQCHLGGNGAVFGCTSCPRIYHEDCLPLEFAEFQDGNNFICSACRLLNAKSNSKLEITTDNLNRLLGYILEGFYNKWGSYEWYSGILKNAEGKAWALTASLPSNQAWRFQYMVYMPMDLETIQNKIIDKEYKSLEEFQVDCDTLAHALAVYFGTEVLEEEGVGKIFQSYLQSSIEELELCQECFQRSHEKSPADWFCLPCKVPHQVVWAKPSGYPYWPAKVMRKDENEDCYEVCFFGQPHTLETLSAKKVLPIDTEISKLKITRKSNEWKAAVKELKKFQELGDSAASQTKVLRKKSGLSAFAIQAQEASKKRVVAQAAEGSLKKKLVRGKDDKDKENT